MKHSKKIFLLLVLVLSFGFIAPVKADSNAENNRAASNNVFINADDFIITVDGAQSLTAKQAIAYSGAISFNLVDGSISTTNMHVDETELKAINAVTGPTKLPLTIYDNNIEDVSTTINVTVIDFSTYYVKAHDFTLTVEEAWSAIDIDLIDKADAQVYDNIKLYSLDKEVVPGMRNDIKVNPMQVSMINMGIPGKYDVTFSLPKYGTYKTVTATIIDDSQVEVNLTANNFSINEEEAKTLTQEQAKEKANATATSNGANIDDKIVAKEEQLSAINNGKAGETLPLTFTVEDNGVTKEVTVNVTIEKSYSVRISASNFDINIEDVKSLNDATVIANSKAKAFNQDNTNINSLIKVNQEELQKIKDTKVPGTFPLTLTVSENGKSAGAVIQVNVFKNYSVDIQATNFTINVKQLNNFDLETAKTLAQVNATNQDGTNINNLVTADEDQLAAIKNSKGNETLPLTFTVSENGKIASKTILVTIVKDYSVNIVAKDFTIKVTDLNTLDDSVAKEKAQVNAINQDGININDLVIVNQDQLTAIKNSKGNETLPLTFEVTQNGKFAKTTIQVTIEKEFSVKIDAQDFTINVNDLAELTDKSAKEKAQVNATNQDETNINDLVTVDQDQLAAIKNSKGNETLPLTFTVSENGKTASKTVQVTIEKEFSVSIDAQDFTINVNDLAELTDQTVKEKAQVNATNQDGTNINDLVTVNQEQLTTIKNSKGNETLPLTFIVAENGKTATKTIQVTIEKEFSVNIDANNFAINVNELAELTDQTVKEKAQVNAINQDGTNINDLVTVDQDQLTAIKNSKGNETLPLTFTVSENGKTASKTIQVTTIKDYSVSIDAQDFTINVNDLAELTDQTAKEKAQVNAINQDGTNINDLVTVDQEQLAAIKKSKGNETLPLTFTVSENDKTASKTIQVTIEKEVIIPEVPEEDNSTEETIKPTQPELSTSKEDKEENTSSPKGTISTSAINFAIFNLVLISVAILGLFIIKNLNNMLKIL